MPTNLAHPAKRFLAWLIDFGLGFLMVWLSFLNATGPTDILNGLIWLLLFWPLLYNILNVLLITTFGGTVGHLVCGLKIVDANGKYLDFKMAIFRYYVGSFIAGGLCGVGYLWVFFDKNRQGWHDKVCGTFVVNKNKNMWMVGIVVLLAVVLGHIVVGERVVEKVGSRAFFNESFG